MSKDASNEQALVVNIEFSADERIMTLIVDNTHGHAVARTANNIYKCLALIAGGTAIKSACRLTGIPRGTLQGWRAKEWYSQAIELIRKQLDEQLDGKMTHILNKGINRLDARLEHGDPVVQRDGTIVYKPVSAKDAAIISSIFFDKRNLLRNKPTHITSSQSVDERLTDLASRFKVIAQEANDDIAIDSTFEEIAVEEQIEYVENTNYTESVPVQEEQEQLNGQTEVQTDSKWCFSP